jgi:hypothetical protein
LGICDRRQAMRLRRLAYVNIHFGVHGGLGKDVELFFSNDGQQGRGWWVGTEIVCGGRGVEELICFDSGV